MRFSLVLLAVLGLASTDAVAVASHRNAAFHRGAAKGQGHEGKKTALFNLVQTVKKGDRKVRHRNKAKVVGQITLKVDSEGQKVSLPQIEQRSLFLAMDKHESSLAEYGFKYWRPTPAGFNFLQHPPSPVDSVQGIPHTASKNDVVVCEASDASTDADGHLLLSFKCEQTADKMRFMQAKTKAKQCPWGYVAPEYYGAYYNPMATGWIPCPSAGAPYGWGQQWPGWNYQYYILSPYGYYGCNTLNGLYCADSPYFYATTISAPYVVAG